MKLEFQSLTLLVLLLRMDHGMIFHTPIPADAVALHQSSSTTNHSETIGDSLHVVGCEYGALECCFRTAWNYSFPAETRRKRVMASPGL